jgi:diaminopimelate epimerase
MELVFYKLHLNSHDFILVNGFSQPLAEESMLMRLTARMCDRRRGIGARGVIFLLPGEEHQGRIVYYDRWGEVQPIPGDALLCAARYAFDFGLADQGTTVLENNGTAHSVQCIDAVHFRYSLEAPESVEGEVIEDPEDADLSVRIRVGTRSLSCTPLRFGGISVAIYADPEQFSEKTLIEGLDDELDIDEEPYFPVGYQVLTRDELSLFFRSPDEGDAVKGAAAAATAAVLGGFCDRDVVIHYRRGKFLYEWQSPSNRVFVTGGPEYSFTGTFELDDESLRDEY